MALYRGCTKVSGIGQSFNPENTGTEGQVLTKTCTGYEYQDLPSSGGGGDELIQSHEGCSNCGTIPRPSGATYATVYQYNCSEYNNCCYTGTEFLTPNSTGMKGGYCFYACNYNDCLCFRGCGCHDINFFGPTYSGVTPGEIEFLIVGGGGGGGEAFKSNTMYYSGGGGGAGGFIEDTAFVKSGVYSITVGAGGYGSGCPSIAFGCVAYGGGYGGTGGSYGPYNGCSGGSGGGGFGYTYNGHSCNGGAGGSGCSGQGYKGGNGDCATAGAGGGGGAGGAGECGNTGTGGIGKCSCISGELQWYAGGGGGAPYGCGSCGGGNSTAKSIGEGCPATTCGSGGGGLYSSSNTGDNYGGRGGNGIVIVRYKTNGNHIVGANGGCKYVCGEYTIHCFTSDGNFEVFTK